MKLRRIAARTIAVTLLAALAAGCAQTRTYQVAVRNETQDPITVGFAKEDGGPYESQWATPEEVAIQSRADSGRTWDSVIVPPGKTGVAGPVKGRFDSAARPYVRVYAAKGTLEDLLAISRGSARRADVPLKPGRNALVVTDDGGKLSAERVELSRPRP